MDVVTLALAKKGAKSYTDTVINNLPKGVVYRGSVNYYADLPSTAALGDCYTVVYKGTTGTEPFGAEYVWGLNTATNVREWIKIGEEIDLSEYATKDWVNTQISDFLPDAETYTIAELTEEQITDVIGVSDILIKGQTSQDGIPTPDSPVDVNVVSGSNVVNTSSKNLLSLPNGTYSDNTLTAIVNKGIITINGTPSTTPTLVRIPLTQPIKLKQNDSVKINVNNSKGIGTSSNYVAFRLVGIVNGVSNDNITEAICTNANANKTFTATNDTIINQVVIRGNANVTFNNFIIKPQIEPGTTTTTYEPHQGKELPLDLPVENLFDKNNETYTNGYINGSSATTLSNSAYNRTLYISCKPNTTYAIQKMVSKNDSKFIIASSVDVPAVEVNIYNVVDAGTNSTHAIYTTSNNAKYLLVNYMQTNITSTTVPEMLNSIQIEQGSKVNAYTPHDTDPIELCKIGNYQDYFYKSGSKWYLHKEIGKVVLDGSESWTKSGSNLCYQTSLIYPSNVALRYSGNFAYSTHYKYAYYASSITSNIKNGEFSWNGDKLLTIGNTEISTLSDFQTWLAVNNPKIYYPLIASTDTEITDTTLISQLEAIYNAPLYEQTNITQTNNDLPMVLDITACKDNINGIKAFIRK